MSKAFAFLARITGRFHLWRLTVFLLAAGVGSPERMQDAAGQLVYALMMCRESSLARRALAVMIHREADSSAENNLWLAKMAWGIGRLKLAILLYKRTGRLFPAQAPTATAASLSSFAEGIRSGKISAEMDAAIERLSLPAGGSRAIILTMASKRFVDIFNIWLRQVEQHTSAYPLIFALDRETAELLRNRPNCGVIDVSGWFYFDPEGRLHRTSISTLWILRVLSLRVLARRKHDVASLDVDAIVVGDLDQMLSSFPDSDIVAQSDYSIPMDVARRFGFILCCGFLVLRASDRTIRFLDAYCERTAVEMDDQLAINHLLADAGIEDKVRTERFSSFRSMGLSWLCPAASLVSRDIHQGSVVRHFVLKDLSVDEIVKSLGLEADRPA